jgi:hypothetical protein
MAGLRGTGPAESHNYPEPSTSKPTTLRCSRIRPPSNGRGPLPRPANPPAPIRSQGRSSTFRCSFPAQNHSGHFRLLGTSIHRPLTRAFPRTHRSSSHHPPVPPLACLTEQGALVASWLGSQTLELDPQPQDIRPGLDGSCTRARPVLQAIRTPLPREPLSRTRRVIARSRVELGLEQVEAPRSIACADGLA